MRELSLSERHSVSGASFNLHIDIAPFFYPPVYMAPQPMVVYEPVLVPCTTSTPLYNHWGQWVGNQIEHGFCESYEPVYYCHYC